MTASTSDTSGNRRRAMRLEVRDSDGSCLVRLGVAALKIPSCPRCGKSMANCLTRGHVVGHADMTLKPSPGGPTPEGTRRQP
jgi:hypothetical protein